MHSCELFKVNTFILFIFLALWSLCREQAVGISKGGKVPQETALLSKLKCVYQQATMEYISSVDLSQCAKKSA